MKPKENQQCDGGCFFQFLRHEAIEINCLRMLIKGKNSLIVQYLLVGMGGTISLWVKNILIKNSSRISMGEHNK